MSETYEFDQMDVPHTNMDNLFISRSSELRHLQEHARKRGNITVITGLGGVGKTTLLKQFLATADMRAPPLIMTAGFDAEALIVELQQKMHDLLQRNEVPEIVAFDNAELLLTGVTLEQIKRIVFNYKRVRSIIFVARHVPTMDQLNVSLLNLAPLDANASTEFLNQILKEKDLNIDASRILQLAQGNPLILRLLARTLDGRNAQDIERFLKGELYNLNSGLIIPEMDLLEVVKPKIITTNASLVERLQKSPQSVHELTPRQYEELLADLLDDMGYEVELTPATRDGGKDIMAYMNTAHGKILCLVEAKKYRSDRTVGVSLVRELFGTLADANATSAMLVTTSSFSPDAKAFQQRHEYKLALRDYGNVVDWIDRYRGIR
jgi:restriction endonuclease Mrr